GDAFAKPNVKSLEGTKVAFEDGSVEDVDAIIWATGYKITFPFFDKEFISAPGNVLHLWKRMFKPEIPDMAFIGLAQPIPTLFPFCEFQAKLASQWLAGRWAPPSRETMESEIARDEAKYSGHYRKRARHTMQLDYYIFRHEMLGKVIPHGQKRAAAR
ncbi:MAG TPA: hypothetical protein VM029_16575, partial [Opitutaceae bacterium]|nr:hypothetical protein [Opitutaceae bacterium]